MKYPKLAFLAVGLALIGHGCKQNQEQNQEAQQTSVDSNTKAHIEKLIDQLEDAQGNHILVVAHRGDWRNAPENSLQAIKNCIDMGVDMVEIDVRETKDGQLVLMHDKTVNRTTKAKGLVKEWTLDSLKTLVLVDGIGARTPHKIPTLEEALLVCKGKILVNLDKSYEIFEKCYAIAEKTGTLNQIVFKGNKTRREVEADYGSYLDKVHYMPLVNLKNKGAMDTINDFMANRKPIGFEIGVPSDTLQGFDAFGSLRMQGASVWVNSLWPRFNMGHDDEKAVLDNSVYDWFIENNINIIQTDRPQVLLNYLRSKGKHE